MHRLVAIALLLLVGTACGERRFYPLIALSPENSGRAVMQLGAADMLDNGLIAAIDEQDSTAMLELQTRTGERRYGGEAVDVFQLGDPSQRCAIEDGIPEHRCRNQSYRAVVATQRVPIVWAPDAMGQVTIPHHVEDLTTFPCRADATCPERLLGVTEFSTIGRVTAFREDQVEPERDASERLFLLERRESQWVEVRDPVVEVLRERLSDWGRATCDTDMIVEGLTFDPVRRIVYIGLNRCNGPVQRVLSYDLAVAEASGPAALDVVANGVRGRAGHDVAGPAEGLSSLDFAFGHVWALTSWDDYGLDHEEAYGGRMLVVKGRMLHQVPLAGDLVDRTDALVMLPVDLPLALRDAPDPTTYFPWISALLLMDNDKQADNPLRPQATLVHGTTPVPANGKHIELLSLRRGPLDGRELALNGFDFQWYLRDHRLGLLSAVLGEQEHGPGAWTTALGGLWQVRLGTSARMVRPILGKAVGHNRQSVELTDYAPAEELEFTSYRAVLSVVPSQRNGQEVSISKALKEQRNDYTVVVPLPEEVSDGAGLVLQGFTFDTSPRASGGICLSAIDVDVGWAPADNLPEVGLAVPVDASAEPDLPKTPPAVRIRAAILGGLCNDFNSRAAEEHHGLTTDPDAGLRLTLYFAVVEGGQAHQGSVLVAARDLPGKRTEPTSFLVYDPDNPFPPTAEYKYPTRVQKIDNHESKDHMVCAKVDPSSKTARALEMGPHRYAPPPEDVEWMSVLHGDLPSSPSGHTGASLSGFAFALDLRGHDPFKPDSAYDDITPLMARSQNAYAYRYQVRTWLDEAGEVFMEGGMRHGVHFGGLGKDNAMATATMLRADLTWWEGLSAAPVQHRAAPYDKVSLDPNVQPEDGFSRWAWTVPSQEEPQCTPR